SAAGRRQRRVVQRALGPRVRAGSHRGEAPRARRGRREELPALEGARGERRDLRAERAGLMPARPDRSSPLEPIRRVPQIRQYASDPVPDEIIDQLLELARWTGSSKNGQPWHFLVFVVHERLRTYAALTRTLLL